MMLTVSKRTSATKSAINTIRREGDIPAVIYGLGQAVEKITVKGVEFQAILRKLPKGQLATSVFDLHLEGKMKKALIKDIQYHVTSYNVDHVDFLLLSDDQTVVVNVPIQILGIAECPGIKLGGTFRQVIRTLKVCCLPKDIPSEFVIDISDLNISQSKRLSDIAMPSGVRAMSMLNEVAVVIAKGKVA